MSHDLQLIIAPALMTGEVRIVPEALAIKEAALTESALIGRVTNKEENEAASRAQAKLKSVFNLFENSRTQAKEPYLEGGRAIDRAATPHKG